MNIVDLIRRRVLEELQHGSKKPKFIYLGRAEQREFREHPDVVESMRYAIPNPSSESETWEGLEILRVMNREHHFNIA